MPYNALIYSDLEPGRSGAVSPPLPSFARSGSLFQHNMILYIAGGGSTVGMLGKGCATMVEEEKGNATVSVVEEEEGKRGVCQRRELEWLISC
ncbi:hypothetical protein SADUNF_Sadunf18G0071000 [Salix dunnii]|uniref:Uncharacterized protein n=1 Tax=Salix dunnii TaxID=1413687 RepID=A0A835J4T8_9ROSI|nr:hypothetical protein SADUNF_Sadunf18G0071000 [Salix dunnii]